MAGSGWLLGETPKLLFLFWMCLVAFNGFLEKRVGYLGIGFAVKRVGFALKFGIDQIYLYAAVSVIHHCLRLARLVLTMMN